MNVAYRLLGSVSEAEDAVQEAYTRWHALSQQGRDSVQSEAGWLVTVVSRICLDVLGSARARREQYVGEWLPEPVPASALWSSHAASDRATDPADRAALDESLSMALLVVLESMTPAERVAFVLHDVFRYTFAEVGEIVGRTPAACRQLATSARRRVREARRDAVPRDQHEQVVSAFQAALATGDLKTLLELLDPNAIVVADGGGLVTAARRPIEGAERIVQFLAGGLDRELGLVFELAEVNGEPGILIRDAEGELAAVLSFAVVGDRIQRVWGMRNPQKLIDWG